MIPHSHAQFLKNMSRKIVTFGTKLLFYKVKFWFQCKIVLFTWPPKWCLVYYKYLVSRIARTYTQFLKNMSRKIVTFETKLPLKKVLFWFCCKIELFNRPPKCWLVNYKYSVSRIWQTYAQFLKNMSVKVVTSGSKLPFYKV